MVIPDLRGHTPNPPSRWTLPLPAQRAVDRARNLFTGARRHGRSDRLLPALRAGRRAVEAEVRQHGGMVHKPGDLLGTPLGGHVLDLREPRAPVRAALDDQVRGDQRDRAARALLPRSVRGGGDDDLANGPPPGMVRVATGDQEARQGFRDLPAAGLGGTAVQMPQSRADLPAGLHRPGQLPGGSPLFVSLRVDAPNLAGGRAPRSDGGARYAQSMNQVQIGDLVTVTGSGGRLDGIVFDAPSRTKVIVAVVEPKRGPSFRTVAPSELAERQEEGPDDQAIRSLLRRTPHPTQAGGRPGAAARKGQAGFTRGAAHRPTGR
jgi:hypothetical protein